MSNAKSIQGRSVLVVDDDYFLAMDACAQLKGAGALVIGPFSQAADALASLNRHRPDLAVVDLNLGDGPNFDLVRALAGAGILVLIMTGYDKDIVPPDLAGVPCLQKPLDPHQLLSAVKKSFAGN